MGEECQNPECVANRRLLDDLVPRVEACESAIEKRDQERRTKSGRPSKPRKAKPAPEAEAKPAPPAEPPAESKRADWDDPGW